MSGFLGSRRQAGRLVAVVLGALSFAFAATATASAANTLALSIEPQIPGEEKPFQVIAEGTASTVVIDEQESWVSLGVGLGPQDAPCSSTAALEDSLVENERGIWGWWTSSVLGGYSADNTPFSEREVFSGRPVGKYRLCGYIHEYAFWTHTYASYRLDFTVGGTCETATTRALVVTKSLRAATKKLKKAKRNLRAAKKRGRKGKILRAQRKVKAARRQVNKAKRQKATALEDRKALC